jgi:hypothetical protein
LASKSFWNFYRLGITAEQSVLRQNKQFYYGIVVSASFASFYQGFVQTFLKEIGKPFIIDPVTYTFARDLNNLKRGDDFRKSFQKLIKTYGIPWTRILERRPLIPKDFLENGKWINENIESMVDKTLAFQRDFLQPKTSMQESLAQYLEMLGEGKKRPDYTDPFFLVAPYFYFSSTKDDWYEITLKLSERADKKKGKYNLFPVVCASTEILLDTSQLRKIVKDYAQFDGTIFWLADFLEERASVQYLKGIVSLSRMFEGIRKPIMMFYGGDFCILLSKVSKTFKGFSRGLCYGTSKDVDAEAAGGGGFPKRFYYDLVGVKLPESIARTFFSEHPEEFCKCKACKRIKAKVETSEDVAEFFDKSDIATLRSHFLIAQSERIDTVLSGTKTKLMSELDSSIRRSQELKTQLYGIQNEHLTRWKKSLA